MKILPKKIIKASLILSVFCFLFFLLTSPIKAYLIEGAGRTAAGEISSPTEEAIAEPAPNLEGITHDLNGRIIPETFSIVIGGPLTAQLRAQFAAKGMPTGGAIGATTTLIATMINNPPVNTQEYLADLGASLGLPVRSAYAQGTGFTALEPVMRIWKAFRNISYMAFVILFVILGFAIMFRTKINPQTVISIQEALPRIIVTLLIITFSYAIASLMIDLLYVAIYLVVGVFSTAGLLENGGQLALDKIFGESLWQLVFTKERQPGPTPDRLFVANASLVVSNIISGLAGGGPWGSLLGGGVGQLSMFVLLIILFFSMFKLFMALLTSYVSIVLSVIFAPLSLLLNVFPGSNSFTAWLRNLLANIAVFPVVAIMFILAAILVGRSGENPFGVTTAGIAVPASQGWTPPFLVGGALGGGGGSLPTTDIVLSLIGLGIILLIPHTVDLVKKTLKVEASPLAAVLAATPGAVMGTPGRAVQTGLGSMTQMHYARQEWQSLKNSLTGLGERIDKIRGVRQASPEVKG